MIHLNVFPFLKELGLENWLHWKQSALPPQRMAKPRIRGVPTVRSRSPNSATSMPAEGLRDFSRSLPMALLRARESVMAGFRPLLRQHGLTEQQWRVLRALSSQRGSLRISVLSQRTLLSQPSLSRLLKPLVARQLVERGADEADQRSVRITITAAGAALVAAVAPLTEARYAAIGELIGRQDLDLLYRLLRDVEARLGQAPVAEAGD